MNNESTLAQYVPLLTGGNMSWDLAGSFSRAFADWVKETSFKNYDAGYAQTKGQDGNLVIVDQLLGDPKMNRQAAERISRRLFEAQQRFFLNPEMDPVRGEALAPPPVVVYAEEAHTLLPAASAGRSVE